MEKHLLEQIIYTDELNILGDNKDRPMIWVACLASYNHGILFGKWIDATQDEDEILDEIKAMLNASPSYGAEEWAIHDYQNFESFKVGEYSNLGEISTVANLIASYESEESGKGAVFTDLIDEYGIDQAQEILDNNLLGCFESENDFIYSYVDDTCLLDGCSKTVKEYFDYESFLRDLKLNGDIFVVSKGYREHYVFYS